MPSTDTYGPPLVVILGPTAVGKTEVAVQLAERLNGEIVSADSRLFYWGMDIGTAKPSREDQQRVPHHLIDVTDPRQAWSLADFQQAARKEIAGIHARGRLPFLVGGTGQYLRAVIEDWRVPRAAPKDQLRAVLEAWAHEIGPAALHTRLASIDPQAAAQIDFRNLRRTVRALEVIFSTGKLFSEQRVRGASRYRLLLLGLQRPREELYARIDARIEAMFAAGFVEEVQRLLQAGYPPELPTLSAIGYAETIEYLQGRLSLEQVKAQMRRRTRQFVRRQANWFKPDAPSIHWFDAGPGIALQMEQIILSWLKFG
jgi:tRNA dimethylallyltransferase